MNRRTVLRGMGAGGVVIVGGLVGWRILEEGEPAAPPTSSTVPPPPPARMADALVAMADALVAVGTRYLETYPDEADQEVLLDSLPALQGEVPTRPGLELQGLAEQAAADHVAGAVVELDGWILSRTECRAAALYAV